MLAVKDRVFVITGANGGMGRAIVKSLAEGGARLAVCGRNGEGIGALKLPEGSVRAVLDVADECAMRAFFDEIKKTFGGADVLVALAGMSIPGQIADIDMADYDAMMNSSVRGSLLAAKFFIPIAKPHAQIINLGSMAALRPNGNAPVYCVAKAALNTLSTALQLQVKGADIRVTTINPGGADTPFWGNRKVARERLLKAEDVARAVMFVAESDPHILFHQLNFESFEAFRQ